MKTKLPPSGMRDFLPREKAVREYVMSAIRKVYAASGFTEIETSYLENIENLTGGDGGENTKLIFKVMKRGDKLKIQDGKTEDDLADMGLRFDLTLPLVRYYANNKNELPNIFKAIQMGPVFRAERAQKGRYRCFTQCDIDVIGDETNLAEMEIILTIAKALKTLKLKDFTIKIGDRRILKALCTAAGFEEAAFSDVAITLDKLDKVGVEGIRKELLKKGYPEAPIEALMALNENVSREGLEGVRTLSEEGYDNLKAIMEVVGEFEDGFKIEFDHTLVRGMGYYTSTIFEVAYGSLGYAIAGGGRYDKMIGKLIGSDVPAVGFSIGFERIIDILLEENRDIATGKKIALLYREDCNLKCVMRLSEEFRTAYDIVSLFKAKKKLGKQIDQLQKSGYDGFVFCEEEPVVKWFDAE